MRKTNILLTGRPGVGKSTLVRHVVKSSRFTIAGGFTTAEIQEEGRRVGFLIESLDGKRDVLAHVNSKSPYRVGRYGVNVPSFERIGVPAIEQALHAEGLVIMDEIGKMEMFSQKFHEMVMRALDAPKVVLGVIQMRRNPFLDRIRERPDTHIVEVTLSNRDMLVDRVTGLLETAFH